MTSTIVRGISFIKEKRKNGEDIKIPRAVQLNDEFTKMPDIPERKSANIVEGKKLETKKIEINTDVSGFSYFSDGIEKKKIIFYYRSIPVIYGYVAGTILKRTDKKLHSIGLEKSEDCFYVPIKTSSDSPGHYFDYEEVQELGKNIKNIGEIPEKGIRKEFPVMPAELIQAAHSEIQTTRGNIEKSLVKKWLESGYDDGWLFVDGRLENKNNELLENSKIVGVIKSHQASYFNYEDQYKIFTMEKGYRTNVFQPEDARGKKENIFSWYLRLHYDKRNGVNDFGLIRVEVPAKEEFIEKADLISGWILLETKPVAFPASRWDRMIYPVKYCEDYLKSKAPSWASINSLY